MLQQIIEQTLASRPPRELDRLPDLKSYADPDAALVRALKAGTANAFDDLVKRHGRRLLNVAMRFTKNREDAEDVVQESFLKVFKKVDGFRGGSKFATWLTRIVINQALMLVRKDTQKFVSIDEDMEIAAMFSTRETAAGGDTPEQLYAQREFKDLVLNLADVRKSSRRAMELYLHDGLSELEVSHVLRLSLSAVKARLYRGRQDLRAAFGRRFRSTKPVLAVTKMSPADAQRSNLRAEILPKSHLAHYNGKLEQRPGWTNASRLARGNPLTARYSQSSCNMEPCLPDHFDPQLLTQPKHSSAGRPENCL